MPSSNIETVTAPRRAWANSGRNEPEMARLNDVQRGQLATLLVELQRLAFDRVRSFTEVKQVLQFAIEGKTLFAKRLLSHLVVNEVIRQIGVWRENGTTISSTQEEALLKQAGDFDLFEGSYPLVSFGPGYVSHDAFRRYLPEVRQGEPRLVRFFVGAPSSTGKPKTNRATTAEALEFLAFFPGMVERLLVQDQNDGVLYIRRFDDGATHAIAQRPGEKPTSLALWCYIA